MSGLAASQDPIAYFAVLADAFERARHGLRFDEKVERGAFEEVCSVVANAPIVDVRLRDLLDYCEGIGIRSEELSAEEAAGFVVGHDEDG